MWLLNSEATTKLMILLTWTATWTNRYNIEIVHNLAGLDYVKLTPIRWYPKFLTKVNEKVYNKSDLKEAERV